MIFDILTICPNVIEPYFQEGIIKRAQKKKLMKINIHNIRDYAEDKHSTVDDTPYGGGPGMVLKIKPIFECIKKIFVSGRISQRAEKIKNQKKCKIILLSPRGKIFNQKMAKKWSRLDRLILISGRYEGVDERVADHIADEIVSIGDYILMGGELAAMAIVETTSRLIPGVIGDADKWLNKKSANTRKKEIKNRVMGFTEFPQYTKPEIFSPDGKNEWKVPPVLISGNHAKINEWREKKTWVIE
jgi:tRNA (guanine37-N1)-methyltransferase